MGPIGRKYTYTIENTREIFWHSLNGKSSKHSSRLFIFELRNRYFTMQYCLQWPKFFALFSLLRYSPLYSSRGKRNVVGHIYSASERNSGSYARMLDRTIYDKNFVYEVTHSLLTGYNS